ncbi:MAG: hypothetical protein JW931_09970 [Methanomicrobiaceae archaeon]|nr:hypothetical protein [Methanomicrobiaceae archaeon]
MDKDIDYSVWSKIIEFEEAIHLNDEKKGEVAAAFTSDGRLMCFFAGFSALMVDEAECPPARGSILTHNHVSDTAFSMHDIKTAAELGLIELRVVGPSGWHSLKPGHGGWPSPFEISKTYNRISSEVAGLPEDCDMKDVSVRICERLVDELGMIYERGNFSHS